MNETDKQKIKDDIQNCFIERNKNTISEKISDLIIEAGFTEDEANHTIIQIVKNLPSCLLPLKVILQKNEVSDISGSDDDKKVIPNVVYCGVLRPWIL